MTTSMTRRLLGGVMAVLLVSGVACKQSSSVQTPAQTATAPTEAATIAALRVKANAGDAQAQDTLGFAYANGLGVPQDYAQAAAWRRKSAEQGYARAQWRLGYAYERGQGVPQDYVQAVAWYRKAADQGDADAQSFLGFAYERGQGVPQDYAQAAAWTRKAADQGDASAELDPIWWTV